MPALIKLLLESHWLWLAARLLLALVFLSSGLAKLIDFEDGMREMRLAGLTPAWLFNLATVITLLSGAALLLLDRALWLGAGALAVFLMLTILLVHRFWMLDQPYAQQAMFWALEHISLTGGLITAAIASHLRKHPLRHDTL